MIHTVFVLSDFGRRDTYSGQMKAALTREMGGAASVSIIDLTDSVPPGDIIGGAFNLMVSVPNLPAGSGLLAVVDPGVGTSRRALVATSSGVTIVCPDNGLLSWVDIDTVSALPLPDSRGSSTFHGRDYFAPALARALLDRDWVEALQQVAPSSLVLLPKGTATVRPGSIDVPIAHVDCFGNCILWLRRSDLEGLVPRELRNPRGSSFMIRSTDAYGPAGPGLLLLEGSCGHLEVALSGGSAAWLTGLSEGDTLTINC